MAENSSTAPGMASNNTYSAGATNDTFTAGGGNDVVNAGGGDDRIAGDGPLPGQWTYGVYTRDFTSAAGQTGSISSGSLQGTGLTTRPGRSSCDESGSRSRVLSVFGG